MNMNKRWRALACGFALAVATAAPTLADDTEIFLNQAAQRGVRPNVLLVMDTSGSMNGTVTNTKAPYDPAIKYAGQCEAGRIYWSQRSGQNGESEPPACPTDQRILTSTNRCSAAREALASAGVWNGGPIGQWDPEQVAWADLRTGAGSDPVECFADSGLDGETAQSAAKFARNGDPATRWTTNEAQELDWDTIAGHTLYSANYLNWLNAPVSSATLTRLETVQAVAKALVASIDGVNLGLMRYSDNADGSDDTAAEGGMVLNAVGDIRENRANLIASIDTLSARGFTPLTETLYEAGQYFAGRAVDYGLASTVNDGVGYVPLPSVAESRRTDDQGLYRTPVEFQCQKNYVIMLTDGEPTRDQGADPKIRALPNFASLTGSCEGAGAGGCLDSLADYLNKVDLSPTVDGQQNVITYTIGFGPEVAGSTLLNRTAERGGGQAFSASDVTELTSTLQAIVSEILATNSTFTTPSVSINAFNRTETLNDLYISVFEPTESLHWPGNLKKYGLVNGRIVDATGAEAVNPATGFFRSGSQSFWSNTPDDDRVEAGGAVSRLPAESDRRIYTYIESAGTRTLTAAVNRFEVDNTALTAELLGITSGTPTREDVIRYTRGQDVQDRDADGDTTETSRYMGDPLHARPAVVAYGGSSSSPNASDSVVFVPTNDGMLHAVDANTGRELWSFVPPELLSRLSDLYRDPAVASRTYGLDADVRVLKFDINQNGIVDAAAGDRVWLYFGMRRGGRWYYALDVTNRAQPQLVWKLGPADLPGVGETWSTPTIARVRVGSSSQSRENFVLVFGGGYDDAQENYSYVPDNSGHRIYMVDAETGDLLWYAGGPEGTGDPDLALANMTNSIPSRVSVIDLDGNGFADRMYAADTGGRVWRFDIFNGNARGTLVTGGVFARLGAGDVPGAGIENARRFYYAPDVALIQRRGADAYYNLAIGSGYRGHPLHAETRDRFYALRDKLPFARLTQAQYDAFAVITESDLVDITDNPASTSVPTTARGWRLELRLNNGWVGEKVLAEATTINGVILFPSYQPTPAASANPCIPTTGVNRVYALNVDSGRPAIDFNDDEQISAADISTELAQSGIAGEVSFAFQAVSDAGGGTGGETGGDGSAGGGPTETDALGRISPCFVGVEVLKKCVRPGDVVRTFWQRTSDDSS